MRSVAVRLTKDRAVPGVMMQLELPGVTRQLELSPGVTSSSSCRSANAVSLHAHREILVP